MILSLPRAAALALTLVVKTRAQSLSPTNISIANPSPVCSLGTTTVRACVTLPPDSTVDKVDIFFLFDDTGSFAGYVPQVRNIFTNLVAGLQTALPSVEFGFGVGRFEDYGGDLGASYGGYYYAERPFVLNQPIVTAASAAARSTTLGTLINDALERTAPGGGGDGPETSISESLYQAAVGDGFDGNGDLSTTGFSGLLVAGSVDTQINPDASGDVPAFSTLATDVVKSGTVGGAGFRSQALKLIILATDICPVAAFSRALGIPATINATFSTEATSELVCRYSGRYGYVGSTRSKTEADAVAPLGAHTVPETIAALNAAGIRVLGMGPGVGPTPKGSGPADNPAPFLSALARMTGAVDSSGQPLVFDLGSGIDATLTTAIVNAVKSSAKLPISVSVNGECSLPLAFTSTPPIVSNVAPGGTACFDTVIEGKKSEMSGSCSLLFADANLGTPLGTIPISVNCQSSCTPGSASIPASTCTNTGAYAILDQGCESFSNKPHCVSSIGRELPADNNGAYCALCINTQQADWVADQGCPADKPMCVCGPNSAPDLWFAGSQCVEFPFVCVNTAAYGGQDYKCTTSSPICVQQDYGLVSADAIGGACVKCVNTQQSDDVVDDGCTSANPRCLMSSSGPAPALNYGGFVCGAKSVTCTNDKAYGNKDTGCTTTTPLCVNNDGSPLYSYGKGGQCVKCVNSYASNSAAMIDDGCTSAKPRCVTDSGSDPTLTYAGTKCA